MSAPPGLTSSPTLSGERITAGHDLETRNGQRRFLCAELGIDQRSAREMIRGYELERLAERLDFLGWLDRLMSEAPLGLKRARKVQHHGWRVATS